ncbi:unnamed protein product, partial [Tilletia caries]
MDDTNSSAISGIPVLVGLENFFAWREAIEPVFIGIRAFDIVRGVETQPTLPPNATSTDVRLSESWKDRDAKAMSYLRKTVSGALKAMIRDLSSSADMWSLLASLHDLGSSDHRSAINRKMANLFLDEGGDMVQHLNSYMELVAEASAAGLPWGTEDKERQLVRVYNEENASQKHTAERSANAMAMAAASQHLHIAIKGVANKAGSGKSSSGGGKKKSSSSPSSSQATSGSSKGKGNSKGNSKRLLCYGCGARDHERPDCPVASHLLPGNGPICWTCHKQGHVKSECPKSTSSSGKAAAALESYPDADEMLAAMFESSVLAASTTSTLIPFMIDSGASQHIVDRPELLLNSRKADKTLTFKTVGSKQASDHIGDVTGLLPSGRRVTFLDVVLLPGAGVNLLSEELLRERGWIKVIDEDDNAHLQHKDNASWRMPLTKRGRARWLLLHVDLAASISSPSAMLAPMQPAQRDPALEVHIRLGHLGFSTI